MLSCTDGMQVSEKIDQLIKENKTTVVVIDNIKYKIEEVKLDKQFIEVNGKYLNLEKVKSLNVSKNELSIVF
jgi:hypothetical protein